MSRVVCRYFVYSGDEYISEITSQTISSHQPQVVGYHESGKGNSDVKQLIIELCTFDKFPRNLHELFPNLSTLWIDKCKLDSISREDIGGLRGLRELCITECDLKYLQGDLLRDLKQLKWVSFEGNQLSKIEPDIFNGLQHLTFANFSSNATINMHFGNYGGRRLSLDAIKAEIKRRCKPKEPQPIVCELSVGASGEYQVSAQSITRSQLKFSKDHKEKISKILSDEAFKDFTIKVGEASFKIHKVLFAAHSATLAEIFRNNPEVVELNLQDIPEAIFKVIYDFIYSEKLPENFDNWTELFVAANRLKIDDLVQIAAEKLQNSITDANAQNMLELANKFNNKGLHKAAFEYLIKKHFPNKTVNKELSTQPEKLKELIETKLKLEHEQEEYIKKLQKLETDLSQL